jgi:hypothetical protein
MSVTEAPKDTRKRSGKPSAGTNNATVCSWSGNEVDRLSRTLDESPKHIYGAAVLAFCALPLADQIALVRKARQSHAEFLTNLEAVQTAKSAAE